MTPWREKRGKLASAGIVEHAQAEDEAVALAILGEHGEAAAHRVRRAGEAGVPAVQPYGPGIGGLRAEDRLGHLGAAAADQAEHADDLAGAHGEAHVLEAAALAEALDLQYHAARAGGRARGRSPTSGRPTIARMMRVLVDLGDRCGQHARAVLEHDDVVGDLEDLLQPMRDVEDGRARRGEAPAPWRRAAPVSEADSTAVGSSRIRMRGSVDQRLGDLDDLLPGDAEAAQRRGGVDIGKAEIGEHPSGDAVRRAPVDDEGTARAPASGRAGRSRRR